MSFTRTVTALFAITTARAVLVGEHDTLKPSPAAELILAETGAKDYDLNSYLHDKLDDYYEKVLLL